MPCGATKIALLFDSARSHVVRRTAVPVEPEDQPVRVVAVVVVGNPENVRPVLTAALDRMRAAGQRRRLAAPGRRGQRRRARRIRGSLEVGGEHGSDHGEGKSHRRDRADNGSAS
jgi:hypothetical protein